MSDSDKKRAHIDEHVASDDEELLLGECSKTHSSEQFKSVTLPIADFKAMQEQNVRILAQLSSMIESNSKKSGDTSRKKRKRHTHRTFESDEAEGERSDTESEQIRTQKLVKNNEDTDMDEIVNRLMNSQNDTLDTSEIVSSETDLKDIAQEYENEEDVGPKISQELGEVIATMTKGKMSDDKLKEKIAKHKRPENCLLNVPRVNSEIWDIMEHNAKSKDLRAQALQKTLLRAVCALASVTDKCLVNKDTVAKTLVKDLMDAIGLVLKASSDVSVDRRAQIVTAPQINRKYRKLLSTEIPITDKLFGDDLKNVCATIDSTSKLGQNFTQSVRGRKFFPHSKNWVNQYSFPRGRGRARGAVYSPQRGRTRGYQRGRGRNYVRRFQD